MERVGEGKKEKRAVAERTSVENGRRMVSPQVTWRNVVVESQEEKRREELALYSRWRGSFVLIFCGHFGELLKGGKDQFGVKVATNRRQAASITS